MGNFPVTAIVESQILIVKSFIRLTTEYIISD